MSQPRNKRFLTEKKSLYLMAQPGRTAHAVGDVRAEAGMRLLRQSSCLLQPHARSRRLAACLERADRIRLSESFYEVGASPAPPLLVPEPVTLCDGVRWDCRAPYSLVPSCAHCSRLGWSCSVVLPHAGALCLDTRCCRLHSDLCHSPEVHPGSENLSVWTTAHFLAATTLSVDDPSQGSLDAVEEALVRVLHSHRFVSSLQTDRASLSASPVNSRKI
jgi:hypothetical protein